MVKRALLLLAVLLGMGLVSTQTVTADEAASPWCFPCAR